MTDHVSRRRLIVNADDFGQSEGVTEGILAAHERGILTSTSMMVRWPGAADAAARARTHPSLSLGLHVDLGEWRSLGGDDWEAIYEVVDLDDAEAITREVVRQFERFETLCGRLPTHVDSHQHIHQRQAKSAVLDLAGRFGIPVRHFSNVKYCGAFYGQTGDGAPLPELIRVPALVATLEQLPEGVTELACHPAMREDLVTMYSAERLVELATLCDPQVRAAVTHASIQLINFADVRETP